MFYEERNDLISQELRFGDIIQNVNLIHQKTEIPFSRKINISVDMCQYAAVMTPCCSIARDSLFSVAPLLKIPSSLAKNDNISSDYTQINRPMLRRKIISSEKFDELSENEKLYYLDNSPRFEFVNSFIYAPHDLLKKYLLKEVETNFYMINFSKIYLLECKNFNYKSGKSPTPPPDVKILQLSDETREELRQKVVNFYGR